MNGLVRTIVAFLVAPLVAATALASLVLIYGRNDAIVMMAIIPFFYMVCAALLVVFGTPIYLVMARLGWLNVWSILSAGIGLGVLVAVGLRFPGASELRDLALYPSIGLLAACAFWAIWSGGRPKPAVPTLP